MYRLLLALSFVAVAAQAQTGDATIDPGMTRAQVVEKLGKPSTVRNYQGSTYLMYPNKCGKSCGMQDIVILDHDVVVDAVFRSTNRHYTGTSSSPESTKPNSRTQRNASLAVPAAEPTATPTAALKVAPSAPPVPADSTKTLTSHPPADSAKTSTSHPMADSVRTPTSTPPTDPTAPTPASTQAPYGKPPTAAPPADSAASAMSHPPVDNSASSTAHPPKPPK